MAIKIKLREKTKPAAEGEAEAPSQRRRPPTHRYLLQVDRQTKTSYPTMEAATAAGMVESTNTLLDAPSGR